MRFLIHICSFFMAFVLMADAERTHSVFQVNADQTGTELNGKPFLVLGLRVSNALISDEETQELITNMDTFASYGINTFSVFFQGSRFGDIKGYNQDATLKPAISRRMAQIIEAADERGMVVLVGVLYHGTSAGKWEDWMQKDANRAVANTIQWLKEKNYRNVFVDVNNEHMADFKDEELIAAGKAIDPTYVMATSGKSTPANADLSIHFGKRDIAGKPYIQTEGTLKDGYWGSYSKREGLYNYINIGVYSDKMKKEMIEYTADYLDHGQGYIFASTWLQCPPPSGPNHTPGGEGTKDDPGIRWWLEFIRDRVGPYRFVK